MATNDDAPGRKPPPPPNPKKPRTTRRTLLGHRPPPPPPTTQGVVPPPPPLATDEHDALVHTTITGLPAVDGIHNNHAIAGSVEFVAPDPEGTVVNMAAPVFIDAELEDDRDESVDIARQVATGVLSGLATEAAVDLDVYERALTEETDPARIARFEYEIARVWDTVLGDSVRALEHYRRALKAHDQWLPAIVAARHCMLAQGDYEDALELFEQEIRTTADPQTRVSLLLQKGDVLEAALDRPEDALAQYRLARDLVPNDPLPISAQARLLVDRKRWAELAEVEGHLANTVASDPHHRAALLVRRARLTEVHSDNDEVATQLYQTAFELDQRADGAIDALKRLHGHHQRWRELVAVLEHEATSTNNATARLIALYRVGMIYAERLNQRAEAIAALENAATITPDAAFVLLALARLYEQEGERAELAHTLGRLTEATSDPQQRLGYLHRIGLLCRDHLNDDEAAIEAFEAALRIDPTYTPALHALDPLYASHERWDATVRMYDAEAEAAWEPPRRATAHIRSAEILERLGRDELAIDRYKRGLALDPNFGRSFRALVGLYRKAQNHHALVELYERAIDRVRTDRQVEFLFAIGDLYRGPLARPEDAERAYQRVLKLEPGSLRAVHALQATAEDYSRYRQLTQALLLESTLISDEAEIVELYHRVGTLQHERLEERQEAIGMFHRALAIDEHHRPTLASLGRIYEQDGHWSALVDIYRRELEAASGRDEKIALLYSMANIYQRQLGQGEAAIKCLRKVLAIDPHHEPSIWALASLLRDRSDWRAVATLHESHYEHSTDPDDRAVAAYRAGEVYETYLGDNAEAERSYLAARAQSSQVVSLNDALVRVQTQQSRWEPLAKELEAQAQREQDPRRAIQAELRAASTWWDRLGQIEPAIASYERVLKREPSNIAALLAVEPLYRITNAFEPLAHNLTLQAQVFRDPSAQASAWLAKARLLSRGTELDHPQLDEALESLLALKPQDRIALDGLERSAIRHRNPQALARIDHLLSNAHHDPDMSSAHLTRRAQAQELGGHGALEIYRNALAQDRLNRGAQRGLARLGHKQHDGEASALAFEIAAETARTPQEAAEYWARSGAVRIDMLADQDAATPAFSQALALNPDHVGAATQLSQILRKQGDFQRLVTKLSQAAEEATLSERKSALWIEVTRIYADDLNNLGAALSSIQRLCDVQAENPDAWLEQAKLLASDRRFDEVINTLNRCLKLNPSPSLVFEAQRRLGEAHESSGDVKQAFIHFGAALALQPEHRPLLRRLVELQLRERTWAAATETATKLVQVSRNNRDRIDGLTLLARARAGIGETSDAMEHLAEAILYEGTRGQAAQLASTLAQTPDDWKRYVTILRQGIDRATAIEDAPSLFLDLAQVQYEQLGDEQGAINTLVEGLKTNSHSTPLRYTLATHLANVGRHIEAIEHLEYAIMGDVSHSDAWRALAASYRANGQQRERDMAICAVAVLGSATPDELDTEKQWQSAETSIPLRAFAPDTVTDLFVAGPQQASATNLLASISEGLARVRPPDLSRYGLGFLDKLSPRSEMPIRAIVDRVASLMGVEEYDVYIHRNTEHRLVIENYARPTLLLPRRLSSLSRPRQIFHLATAFFHIARGTHTLENFTAHEVGLLLAGSAQAVAPSVKSGHPSTGSDGVLERGRIIAKAVSRKRRPRYEAAALAYLRAPPLDMPTYVQWARQTARRVALICCDDLRAGVEELARLEGAGPERILSSPQVADLLRVWMSRPAMTVRRRTRLLPSISLS